ncbi:putative histidyl-tRNA synthetase [Monocercomonoides exilis]|uniref:putative histidyl-tRNA synthetase n=1 Tax=Monocercomonoides exilis TaxID=2049356 RepID=UPI00355A2F91|nr:putative histidyl-tRNA synthetase [Monocercomonoides exilis]|eukprot:MONOS_2719.1-p1 / transcript=MONOS_2719.1 / gene=MONOS_2719 / organism=Monocercomonoides_exilis_PA203 / gene_product=histidyl-tRNA synthetase / transcript_product=histidyl-tRNA synthetase / location=Mono_scaffold00057:116422-118455(-) / protein_length=678 / sequence_SO=supercontig / SO=protein_coding / is_pseudo=false
MNAMGMINIMAAVSSDAEGKQVAQGFILKPPKGMQDIEPNEMAKRDWVLNTIESVFKKHSIPKLDTPVMERREILYAKASEETTKQIYDIVPRVEGNEDEKEAKEGGALEHERLALRFDLTVSLARYVAQHNLRSFARYQYGKVYRGENVSKAKGRFREFMQFDFDMIGVEMPDFPDIRTILILAEIFQALSLTPTFTIFLNHRVLLRALMGVCGVQPELQMTCCSSIDKLDKLPWAKVEEELIGKGVNKEAVSKLEFLDQFAIRPNVAQPVTPGEGAPTTKFSETLHKQFLETLEKVEKMILDSPFYQNEKENDESASSSSSSTAGSDAPSAQPLLAFPQRSEVVAAIGTLRKVYGVVSSTALPLCLCFNPSLARGHDYYTGLIFEGCFWDAATGMSSQGTCVGGGRYDKLIGILSPSLGNIPAIGFGIGFERLVALVTEERLREAGVLGRGKADVMVAPIGFSKEEVGGAEVLGALFRAEMRLAASGLRVELWKSTNCNTKQIIPECVRQEIAVLVQMGQREVEEGTVVAKRVEERKKNVPGGGKGKKPQESKENAEGSASQSSSASSSLTPSSSSTPSDSVQAEKAEEVKMKTFSLEDKELIEQIRVWMVVAERERKEREIAEREQKEKEAAELAKKEAKRREKERRREQAKAKEAEQKEAAQKEAAQQEAKEE